MHYFAVHVWTGKEVEYTNQLRRLGISDHSIVLPKKVMKIKKRGKEVKEIRPIFPGYVFIASDQEVMDSGIYWRLRRQPYFVRLLPKTAEPKPISAQDKKYISHFISFGEVADVSKVRFDENQKIRVLEGALEGFEGMIVKVDRRKKRAKIRLNMCDNAMLFDLSFDVISDSGENKA